MELAQKKLPIYKACIKDSSDLGVDFVALVDNPAIERVWQTFDNTKKLFEVQSKEKRIVMGALMVANLPIYRRDDERGEYFIVFDKETIEKIVHRFFKNKFTHNVNLMHNGTGIEDVYLFESIIIDSTRGIETPKGFDKLPDGSWLGSYKVENEKIWQEIIEGKFLGFSVEGYFNDNFEFELTEDLLLNVINAIQQ